MQNVDTTSTGDSNKKMAIAIVTSPISWGTCSVLIVPLESLAVDGDDVPVTVRGLVVEEEFVKIA